MTPHPLAIAAGLSAPLAALLVLWWWNKRKAATVETLAPASLRFIGEQDGPREKVLKETLSVFFGGEDLVETAYLARLDIGEGHTVGLCLRTRRPPDESYPARVAELFVKTLGPGGALHVLFLDEGQESALAQVCRPFYRR